ncbi:MAG: hypothetical protein OJF49_003485 [Ktedonobacterales bacterium]|nr:MAG: hypothetical protein OJF49_003485 [Ktedonobacterales bacterium]
MPRKLRELRADLRRNGWHIARQRGSHETWKHPLIPGKSATLAGKDGADAKPYQEQEIAAAVEAARAVRKGQQP